MAKVARHLFSHLFWLRGWRERSAEFSCPNSCLTSLETKSLIRPEEVKLSLSWGKRAGDRLSTCVTSLSTDKYDKVAETICLWAVTRGKGGVRKHNWGTAVYSTYFVWLVVLWAPTLRATCIKGHLESFQAGSGLGMAHLKGLLLNSRKFRVWKMQHFFPGRASPRLPHWLSAHNTIIWLSSLKRNLMEDSFPSKVNRVLSYRKCNNLVRK